MNVYIILILNLLLFSYQSIQAGFFCDNYLREVYLIDENSHTQKVIANGWEGFFTNPYIFENLQADPGDLIKFKCYNVDGWTNGAGCFIVNEICRCYNFDNDIKEYTDKIGPLSGTITFNNNRQCNIDAYRLKEFDVAKDYYYQHRIPLDVD